MGADGRKRVDQRGVIYNSTDVRKLKNLEMHYEGTVSIITRQLLRSKRERNK